MLSVCTACPHCADVRLPVDTYTLAARIGPALAVASPLLIFGVFSASLDLTNGVLGLLVFVLCLVAANLARDAGKRLESQLYEEWGGKPTLRRMRFSGEDQAARVADRHAQLERVLGRALPGPRDEEVDPTSADGEYEAAVADLRDMTRDRQRFALLFRENVDFGFRRNLLGLRPIGIAASVLGLVAAFLVGVLADAGFGGTLTGAGIPGAWFLCSGAFFIWAVTPSWVRTPAEEYADRLFGTLRVL